MENQILESKVIKQETVTFLKSKFAAWVGNLTMTEKTLRLTAHKQSLPGLGLIGAIAKAFVEKEQFIFELPYNDIASLKQGKQGFMKNILEITDKQNNIYRMNVKNYAEWEQAIKERM